MAKAISRAHAIADYLSVRRLPYSTGCASRCCRTMIGTRWRRCYRGKGKDLTKRVLALSEANKVLPIWNVPAKARRRNNALIAVLALGALRRSEAAALQWRDVDFENGVVTVRHGKGDKAREVPLAGDFAVQALRAW